MAKLINVITKKIWDPWIHPLQNETGDSYIPNEFFTQEEIDNVLVPFLNYAKSQAGLIPSSVINDRSGNEEYSIREYDTLAHAQQAALNLSGRTANPDPIVTARNELMRQKTEAAQVTYSYSTKII